MLYFAYGSNLNLTEMNYRCPSAEFLGVGVIEGFELEFRNYLSIRPNPNSSISVGVFNIENEDDWKSLDMYEGYPNLYYKKELECKLNDNIVKGTIYIMQENELTTYPHNSFDEYTGDWYLQRCIVGYNDCNIHLGQLAEAYKKCFKGDE